MSIDSNSNEDQVYTYLSTKCSFLTRAYERSVFEGIDGEVFLGLTNDTVEMIFPNISLKDKGLLLARVEGARFGEQSRAGTPRSVATPKPIPTPRIHPTVTPPFTLTTSEGEEKHQEAVVKVTEEQKRVPPLAREVTPPIPVADTQYRDSYHPIVLPRAEELPRILCEFWRHSTTDGKDDFLAETWLPNLKEIELRSETFRLALRRCIESRTSMLGGSRIVAARKWFGALILSGRYFRVDNRLDLFVMEVKEIELIGWESDMYYFKLYTFVPGGNLNHVYTSNKLPIGSGRFNNFPNSSSSSNSVEFDEQITMRFGVAKLGQDTGFEPVIGAASTPSPTNRNRSNSSVVKNLKIFTNKTTSPVSNVEVLRLIMMRSPETPPLGDPQYDRILSLHDLLVMLHNGSTQALDPCRNRFEFALLPTHEVSALRGTEFMLRSMAQVEALRSDSAYMHNHSQVIELLLSSWGFGADQPLVPSAWQGHTWLLRHALLSAIILDNTDEAKRLVKVAKELSTTRQIDLAETGFGEAVLTLDGDREQAQIFWDSHESHSGGQRIKSPYLPSERSTLSSLMNFVIKNGAVL